MCVCEREREIVCAREREMEYESVSVCLNFSGGACPGAARRAAVTWQRERVCVLERDSVCARERECERVRVRVFLVCV